MVFFGREYLTLITPSSEVKQPILGMLGRMSPSGNYHAEVESEAASLICRKPAVSSQSAFHVGKVELPFLHLAIRHTMAEASTQYPFVLVSPFISSLALLAACSHLQLVLASNRLLRDWFVYPGYWSTTWFADGINNSFTQSGLHDPSNNVFSNGSLQLIASHKVIQQTANKHHRELKEDTLSLPLPAFPPALDFDPNQFLLPPSYEEVIDIEKALHLVPSGVCTSNDASNLCISSTPSDFLSRKVRIRQEQATSPPTRCIRVIRHLRFTLFTVYRRLFTLVFVLNLIGVAILLQKHSKNSRDIIQLDSLATFASSNFLLAIFIRQDCIVNLLFRTAWLVPWTLPLRIRTMMSRVYCYGGIHSGAAVVGTIWWLIFTGVMTWTCITRGSHTFPVMIITWVVLLLLMTVLLLAFPTVRAKYHDTFEMTHRFLGWTSIGLFWAQLLLLSHDKLILSESTTTIGSILLRNPTFWNLSIITLLLIYPWLRLRRWNFTAQALSSHALQLSFPNTVHKFSCLSISSSPLYEWHPFATFPSTDPDKPGASMVISDAGDWTRNIIQHAQMRNNVQNAITKSQLGRAKASQEEASVQMRFWVKSHPKAGVLSLSCLFPRVLIVTTGSGIGPSLSSLLDRPPSQFARLVWSTRSPLTTFGPQILSLVDKADPDALIIDTSEMGRPNLLEVAWGLMQEVQAEAVFVLSNEAVTKAVVGGLEKRGVRAFGPIWDS
ncbi:Nn.00g012900.m01.CDS01 [Neocucurbitaria sp. VM-36]